MKKHKPWCGHPYHEVPDRELAYFRDDHRKGDPVFCSNTCRTKSIDELIAASSLGTPGAVAVRAAGRSDAELSKFERDALETVKGAERDRVAEAIFARANRLAEWMRELPINSEKRKELSLRAGEMGKVARGIKTGEIFLSPGK